METHASRLQRTVRTPLDRGSYIKISSPGKVDTLFKKIKNKDRLYIALYALGGELGGTFISQEYHWAFLIAPKKEAPDTWATRYITLPKVPILLINNEFLRTRWALELDSVPLRPHQNVLGRALIGKINDRFEAERIIGGDKRVIQRKEEVAVLPSSQTPDYRTYRTWVSERVTALREDEGECVKYIPEWREVQETCERFVEGNIR